MLNVSSDAAVEAYEGWGGYGASKAALDQLSAVLGVEAPQLRVYAVDPGDMRTDMHQRAFPGEDISDRPLPRDRRAGAAAAARRAAGKWPLPRGRLGSRRGGAMTATTFELPEELEAAAPPTRRDAVRLLVAGRDGIRHADFAELGGFLEPGDLVVVNTSGTLPAAVDGTRDRRPPGDRPLRHCAR